MCFFGFGPLNIIWNTSWCIYSWWVAHCSAWTPADFKESAESARTHSAVKTWPRAQCILLSQQKICSELCLGKALCTSVGDSHQCVWCCFLAILDAGGRKISIKSSFEATQIKLQGHRSAKLLPSLKVADFWAWSVICPALFRRFSEVIPVPWVHFGLWSEVPGTVGWSF